MKSIKEPVWILKNIEGKQQHYGNCLYCGDYWNWKTPHHIYSPWWNGKRFISGGAFPYCKECNLEISKLIKIWLMVILGYDWFTVDPRGLHGKLWCISKTVEHIAYIIAGG